MILLIGSAAFVGFFHSLAPGHWLPVVLISKSKKWGMSTAAFGAVIAASGHILLSIGIGAASVFAGTHFLHGWDEVLEKYAALGLILFGFIYAGFSYFSHSHCVGHSHHGPVPTKKRGLKGPFLFLFSLGFSPCVAAIPVFLAASSRGPLAVILCMSAFSCGVLLALLSATLLAVSGITKIDHELFEHHGDVVTGLGVALMGAALFIWPM
ncbi:MAG: hypothetical protein AABZ55_10500 [Bdellovibrionota bacterium]